MRKAEKVECLGLPFSAPLPVLDRKRSKFQQPRFLGMQFQVELSHSFRKFRPKLIGIRFVPKSNHDVIRKSHDDDITVRPLLTPRLDPQVEHVMKIDVCQKRRSTPALGRPFLHPYPFPIFQHRRSAISGSAARRAGRPPDARGWGDRLMFLSRPSTQFLFS